MANIAGYIANLGKSIGYSSIDKMKEIAPNIVDFGDTNKEIFKDLYNDIREFRTSAHRTSSAIKNSKLYEAADIGIKAIFEDLKSGKFYNKERDDEISLKALGSLGDFGDDFDLNMLDDIDFDDESSTDAVAIAVARATKASGGLVSDTIAKTGQYVSTSNRISTNLLYNQNAKAYGKMNASLESINNNVANMLKFSTQTIQTHAENSKRYYEETTTLLKDQTALLRQIADSITPKKKSSSGYSERVTINDVLSGGFNAKNYAKNVKNNFKNEFSMVSGLGDMFGEDSNIFATFASSPLKFITNSIANNLISGKIETSMKALDKSFGSFFGSMISKLNILSNNSDNELLKYVGKLFGVDNSLKTGINTANYEKGKVDWTGKSDKTLNVVIPTYLRKILSAVTGTGERIFDHNSGRFTDIETIEKDFNNQRKNNYKFASFDMREQMKSFVKSNVKFKSKYEHDNLLGEIETFFEELYKRGGYFDVNGKDDNDNINYNITKKNYDLIKGMFKSMPRHAQLEINNSILKQREDSNRRLRNIEEDPSAIEHYLFNNSNINEFKKSNSSGKIISPFLSGTDDLGNNIFYYLKGIFKHTGVMAEEILDGGIGSNTIKGRNGRSISSFPVDKVGNKYHDKAADIIDDDRTFLERQERKIINKDQIYVDYDDPDIDLKLAGAFSLNQDNKNRLEAGTNKKFIDKLLEANGVMAKFKVFNTTLDDIASKPIETFAKVIDRVDQRLYQAVYGRTESEKDADKGFLNQIIMGVKGTFQKVNDWIDESILKPIRDKVNVDSIMDIPKKFLSGLGFELDKFKEVLKDYLTGENGILTRAKEGVKSSFKGAGGTVKNAFGSVFGDISSVMKAKSPGEKKAKANLAKSVLDTINDNIDSNALGGKINSARVTAVDEGEHILSADESKKVDTLSETLMGVSEKLKDATDNLLNYLKDGKSGSTSTNTKFGTGKIKSKTKGMSEKVGEEYRNFYDKTMDVLGGKSKLDTGKLKSAGIDILSNIREYVPELAGGGAIGGLIGLLAGGPLIGAGIGAATAMIKKSDKLQDFLFGEKKDGVYKGGLINKNIGNKLSKIFPDLRNYGIVGGVSGLLPFMPFGPVGGVMLGAGMGFLKNTDTVQKALFGDGHSEGMLTPERQAKIKKMVPRSIAAMIPTMFLGPFGLVGNAALGAGIGMLSTTTKAEEFIFGKKSFVTGKYENGMLPTIRDTIVNPIQKFLAYGKDALSDWFKDKIMKPLENAITPIATMFKNGIDSMINKITDYLGKSFENSIGIPFNKFLEQRVIKPVTGAVGGVIKGLLYAPKKLIELPFWGLDKLGTRVKTRQIKKGNASYMTAQERLNYRNEKGVRFSVGDKTKDIDTTIAGLEDDDVLDLINSLGLIKGGKDTLINRRGEMRDNIGSEVSSYMNKYSRTALGKIMNTKYSASDVGSALFGDTSVPANIRLQWAQGMINQQRQSLTDVDSKILRQIEKFKNNKVNNKDPKVGSLMKKLSSRIDDPKLIARLNKAIRANDYDEVTKILQEKTQSDDDEYQRMTAFLNGSYSQYADIEDVDKAANSMIKNASQEISNYSGFNLVDKNGKMDKSRVRRLLSMLNNEASNRGIGSVLNFGKEDSEETIDTNTISSLDQSQYKRHTELMDVLKDTAKGIKELVNVNRRTTTYTQELAAIMAEPDALKRKQMLDTMLSGSSTPGETSSNTRKISMMMTPKNKMESAIRKATGESNTEEDGKVRSFTSSGQVIEFVKTGKNDYEPDKGDKGTREALAQQDEDRNTQKGIFSKLSDLSGSLGAWIKETFNVGGKKSEEESWLSNLLSPLKKVGLGIAGLAGLGIAGPFLSSLWSEKIQPFLQDTALPAFGSFLKESLPIIGSAIKTAIIEGMPYIVQGIGDTVKWTATELVPAAASAVGDSIGLSGENGESSVLGAVAGATGRQLVKGTNSWSKLNNKLSWGISKGGVVSKTGKTIVRNGTKAGTTVLSKATDILGKPVNALYKTIDNANIIKGKSLSNIGSSIASSLDNKTISVAEKIQGIGERIGKKAAKNATKETVEKTIEKTVVKGTVGELIDSITKKIVSFLSDKVVTKLLGTNACKKLITKFVPKLTEQLAESALKGGAKASGRLAAMASTAGLATIVLAVADFVSGWNKARSILGITDEASFGQKACAGLISALTGAFLITSIIPESLLVSIVIDYAMPAIGVSNLDIQQQRKEAQEKVDKYNSENGTDYSIEQYNKEVQGDKTTWEMIGDGITNLNYFLLGTTAEQEQKDEEARAKQDTRNNLLDTVYESINKIISSIFLNSTVSSLVGYDLSIKMSKALVQKIKSVAVKKTDELSDEQIAELVESIPNINYANLSVLISDFTLAYRDTNPTAINNASNQIVEDANKGQRIAAGLIAVLNQLGKFTAILTDADVQQIVEKAVFDLINPSILIAKKRDSRSQTVYDNSIGGSLSASGIIGYSIKGDKFISESTDDNASIMATEVENAQAETSASKESILAKAKSMIDSGMSKSDVMDSEEISKMLIEMKTNNPEIFASNEDAMAEIYQEIAKYQGGVDLTISKYNRLKNKGKNIKQSIVSRLANRNSSNRKLGMGGEDVTEDNIRDHDITANSSIGENALDNYLDRTKKGTSFEQSNAGKYFVEAGRQSKLDPRFLMALAGIESGWGNSNIAKEKYNYYGWQAYNDSPGMSAKSYDGMKYGIVQGAKDIAEQFANHDPTQRSVNQFEYSDPYHVYSCNDDGSPNQQWISSVGSQYLAMPEHGDFVSAGDSGAPLDINGDSSSSEEDNAPSNILEAIEQFGTIMSNRLGAMYGFNVNTDTSSEDETVDDTSTEDNTGGVDRITKASLKGANPADSWFKKTLNSIKSSSYGWRKNPNPKSSSYGQDTWHEGNDYAVTSDGQEVKSPISGNIVYKAIASEEENKAKSGYGNAVGIKDKNGYIHLFGHMKNKPNVKYGQMVSIGDKVGNVGSTGASTGPHLHYGIYKDSFSQGKDVDPNKYLSGLENQGGVDLEKVDYTNYRKSKKESTLGKGGSSSSNTDFKLTISLIKSIINVLVKISDNTSLLQQIVNILTDKLGVNIDKNSLTNLDKPSGKSLARNITSQISNRDEIDNQTLLNLLNQLATE